jgi:hypothetical protein
MTRYLSHKQTDEFVYFTSLRTGKLRVFLESPIMKAAAETVILISDPAAYLKQRQIQMQKRPSGSARQTLDAAHGLMLVPVSWQGPPQPQPQLKLRIERPAPDVTRNSRQQTKTVIGLYDRDGSTPASAIKAIHIKVRVTEGNALVETVPETGSSTGLVGLPTIDLTIPPGSPIKPSQTTPYFFIFSRTVGEVKLRADAVSQGSEIEHDELTYKFSAGTRATRLEVKPRNQAALANGLSPIEIQVKALQKDDQGNEYEVLPADEGLEMRVVGFSCPEAGPGLKFDEGGSEITIPKDANNGKKNLFSVMPSGTVTVVAESMNGLRETIQGTTTVSFVLPWIQLLCASLGGLAFSFFIDRALRTQLAGLLTAVVFFGLALFGAIGVSQITVSGIPVDLARLSTENYFAAFILGVIGCAAWRGLLVMRRRSIQAAPKRSHGGRGKGAGAK